MEEREEAEFRFNDPSTQEGQVICIKGKRETEKDGG